MHLIPALVLLALLLAVLIGPQFWVQRVLKRHSRPRDDFPGTGGEFARHLLDRFGLQDVGVEITEQGDHYDPEARCVRLLAEHHDGRTLTGVVIAAHEVGHALQHASGHRWLAWRSRLVKTAQTAEKLGAGLMIAIPFVAVVTRLPATGLLLFLAGLASLGLATLVHLVTLPVELDASFRRALPILETGRYIPEQDLPAARQILRAAALTYAAGSLMSLLNLGRWIAILRR